MAADLDQINELTREAYNRTAGLYHDLFKDELSGKEHDRKILDLFSRHFTVDSVIYDMGCGPSGHIAGYLHDKGLQVTGVDISENCVTLAAALHPDMTFLRMDFSRSRLQDRSLDGIISFYSLIHTPKGSVAGILGEFRRILKKGGKLLLAVKKGDEEGYLEEFLGKKIRIWFSNFKKDEIEGFLLDGGFRILLLEERAPYEHEIPVSRIFCIGEKV